jgi:hypothetical protein
MKKKLTLTFKITSFSTVIVLLASIIAATVVYSITSEYILNTAVKRVNAQIVLVANDIQNALIKISSDMKVLIKSPSMQGITANLEELSGK